MEFQMDRRNFLKKFVGVGALYTTGAAGLLLPKDVVAATSMADFWSRDRTINCKRADTGEKHEIRFFQQQNGYDLDAYRNACWLMRDAKDGNAMVQIDVGLLNLMYAMQEWARQSGRSNPVITINSAYRTPRRNATIEGAARNSLHMRGKAVDFTMRGVGIGELEQMAKYYNVGGIGIYNSFVHLDTGRVRHWRG